MCTVAKISDRSTTIEIKRDLYLNRLIARKNNCLIKVITGVRRCRKSYLLNTIFYRYLLEAGKVKQQS